MLTRLRSSPSPACLRSCNESVRDGDGPSSGTRRRLANSFVALLAACAIVSSGCARWTRVAEGSELGISGIALERRAGETSRHVVVHDASDDAGRHPRIGLVHLTGLEPRYEPLVWDFRSDDEIPRGLAGISAIPDSPGEFLALERSGHIRRVHVCNGRAETVAGSRSELPRSSAGGTEHEGISVWKHRGMLVATWVVRGEEGTGRLCWGEYVLQRGRVEGITGTAPIEIDGSKNTILRNVTDVFVGDDRRVWITSTRIPGLHGNGSARSWVHVVGKLERPGEEGFCPRVPAQQVQDLPDYRAEGLVLAGDLLIVASDNGNDGAAIHVRDMKP